MRSYPSLIGQRFGSLVVQEQLPSTAKGHRRWLCRCDCGNDYISTTDNLKRRSVANCGCLKLPDLTGQRFGMVVVEQQLESTGRGDRRWLCRCDCGNTYISTTGNLKRRTVANCGCLKSPDLTGQIFGRLTVLGRSDKRSPRGKRTSPQWECRCECGAITYKATDTLKNPDQSMCKDCADQRHAKAARDGAGYVAGTQISKIQNQKLMATNTSGFRGVYLDKKTNRYRARLTFQGKIMSFGSYERFEDAVKARQRAEEEIFGKFLETMNDE